jgi:hypothetical protein
LPKKVEKWSLTSLQQRLVKTGGRLIKHARYYWRLLAECHLTRRLFGSMLRQISGFATASRIGAVARRNQSGRRRGVAEEVSEKSLRNGANHGLLVLAKALPGASGSLAMDRMQKKIAAAATGAILGYSREAKWKSRLNPDVAHAAERKTFR